ncbi:MAG TPA: BTAD domain-containing putative transcriptional regulator [Actinophytocola sp.]|nr:BTAD domain-containing putative transcriptional regulator [Actinophytocola sp.]
MLAALLLRGGRALPIMELIEWVWPDGKEPEDPVGTLYSYATRIRPFLRRMNPSPDLASADGAYRIDVDPSEVDYFAFRATVEKARAAGERGDHVAASRELAGALDLWGDRPLADLQSERAANWRRRSEADLWIPAQDLLMQELSAVGRYDQVLHRLPELPAVHSLVKRKLEALYGLGRSREAKNFFLGTRKQLLNDGDHDEADDLLRFHDSLLSAPRGTAPAVDVTPTPDRPHLLCRDITDFAGREDLLRRLDEMTTNSSGEVLPGVVTVDGVAGVGKTTLAVHWAHAAASRFPGGVLSADLGGFSAGPKVEVDKVVDEFLGALGFPAERIATTAGRAAKLRDLLANRCALVLLDNAFNSSHVDSLLDYLPGCVVVVTSRQRLSGLGRRGAVNLTVAPLSYQESKAWLAGRIGARVAGAADLLAELCGGNILVLRVVAQHVATAPHVPVAELVDELRDSRKLLDLGDDGDGPDSSVRAALSWSYRHLVAEEQRVLRLVGLHPGPDISVDLLAALAGQDGTQAERSLGFLVNSNLLTRMSRERYRLHDLVRKYAAERIAAPEHTAERAAAAERLLSYFLHTASNADRAVFPFNLGVDLLPLAPGVVPLTFPGEEAAMDWCTRERSNIDAVIDFASREEFHAYVPKLTNNTGEIFQRLGYYEDVVANLHRGVRAARILGEVEEEGDVLSNLALLALNRRDFMAAESFLTAAENRYGAIGYEPGLGVATNHRGRLFLERGEYERGIGLLRKSLAMLRRAGVEGYEILALHRLGEAHRRRCAYDEAASFCQDGLRLAERLEHDNGQARCLTELALTFAESGDEVSARGYATRALGLHERLRDRAGAGKTANLLARLDLERSAPEDAERHARMGLGLCRTARDTEGEGTARHLLAQARLAQADHDEAAREWALALIIFEDLRDPRAASVRTKLAELPAAHPLVPETRTAPLTRGMHVHRGVH